MRASLGLVATFVLVACTKGTPENVPSPDVDKVASSQATSSQKSETDAEREARLRKERAISFAGFEVYPAKHFAAHTHGDNGTHVDAARFEIRSTQASTLRVQELEMTNKHCSKDAKVSFKKLNLLTIEFDATKFVPHAPFAVPADGKWHTVKMNFKPESVYQACDKFGYQVNFSVDGKPAVVDLDLRVTRFEPYRK